MKSVGGWLLFFGIGSMILYFLNMEFIVMSWVDIWGTGVGWTIRTLMAGAGAAMWFLGQEE